MSSFGGRQKTLLKQASKRGIVWPSGTASAELQREGPIGHRGWEQCLQAPLGKRSLGRTEAVGGALPGGISSLPDPGLGQRTLLMPPTRRTNREQGRAEALQTSPSDSARIGGAPRPGPGPLAVERCQPKQGLGRYLKAAMASMACCHTAVRR